MTRRREDPVSPNPFTYPMSPKDLTTAFTRQKATTTKPVSRKQAERLPTSKTTYYPEHDEADVFKEPVFDELPASQLPSFKEPDFSSQPTGRNGLIPDTDDEMATEVADRAASAQLQAEEARQTRQTSTKAPQGATTGGPTKRSAPQHTGAPSPNKKITFASRPEYVGPQEPKGPLSYLRDHHAILEPSYPLTPQEKKDLEIDANVIEGLSQLRTFTEGFCSNFFAPELSKFDTSDLQSFLNALKTTMKQTIYYAGAIADGGPEGLKGWVEIIREPVLRQALVYGIIHRVLKEHVFGALLFGGPADLVQTLEDLEKEQKPPAVDGFIRSETRAHAIVSWELENHTKLHDCEEREQAILKISFQIEELIWPIYSLQFKKDGERMKMEKWRQQILLIVTTAADLSVYMRRNGDSVLYHIFPVFKGENLNLSSTDIFNLESLTKEYKKFDAKERAAAHPLVRIVCTFQFEAYRKHGGVMAERLLEKEENTIDHTVAPELRGRPRNLYRGRVITARDGFRSKTLTKAVVAVRFGTRNAYAPKDPDDRTVELADTIKAAEAANAATGKCGVM